MHFYPGGDTQDRKIIAQHIKDVPGSAITAHLHAGNPVDLLPQISADIGANLVIMGAISRSRLENAIVGSTAENVLDFLGCDVLVLKPKGFISPVTFKTVPKGAIFAD